MKLRNLFVAVGFILLTLGINAQTWMPINQGQQSAAHVELINGNPSGSSFTVELDGFMLQPVSTPRGEAFTVSVEGATPLLEQGMPDLPKITTSLIIPDAANMQVSVINSEYRDFENIEIAPSKGNFTRDINPADVPYSYSRVYDINRFYPYENATLRDPYILRDYRGQTVVVQPFVYNPVTKVLRVYYKMTLQLTENGTSAINTLSNTESARPISSEYRQIYLDHFLNAETANRVAPLEEDGKMLIISHPDFMDEMQPFIDWKKQTGMPVEIVDVSTIGVNATAIKTFVTDYYNNNGLTFLLLVGDHQQVPTITGGSLGGPSDNAYGYILGNDHYQELFVGRFSASTPEHVVTQVERSLEYEMNPDLTEDWFSRGMGIGSSEGTGDDNEYDWQHMRNIRTVLMNFTYTAVAEVYDGSQGGEDLPGNPNATTVANVVNPGITIANYVGHGSDNSWSTTGFNNNNVNQLTNNHRWPLIISVACVNGNFLNQTCFGEAWVQAKNDDGPTGAVGIFCSTINQSWAPPMEAQDKMNDILGEVIANNIKRTYGGVAINGCFLMNDAYGSGGNEMTDTWIIFGDPSIVWRTAMPQTIAATHEDVAFLGTAEFVVNCPVDGAKVCITKDGEILGTAIAEGGSATVSYETLNDVGNLKITITAFNHLPYVAEIEIIPLEGPYVVFNSTVINDATGNNNQMLDYNETILLSLALKNVGLEDVANVNVVISSENEYVVLNDTEELYALIEAGETVNIEDAFGLTVAANVPEGIKIPITYTATAGDDVWTGTFNLTAHSVVLEFAGATISDETGNNNGKVEAGETVILNLSVTNKGTATATGVYGALSTSDEYVYINIDSVQYGTLEPGETLEAAFMVTAQPNSPTGHPAVVDFTMGADFEFAAAAQSTFVVGQIPVLIIDLDGNHNSAPVIQTTLTNIGITSEKVTTWPSDISAYQSVFVCLGIYSSNVVLTNDQGTMLADFMTNGGKVYMEGGDTWHYNTPTPAHAFFHISGNGDGSGDLATINGVVGTITEGMSFSYDGDNDYIDRLLPGTGAQVILTNSAPVYNTAIAFDGGNYKTIGASCEFGGLVDAGDRSVKDSLMTEIINYFGLVNSSALFANFVASDMVVCEPSEVTFTDFSAGNVISWEWSFPGGVPATSTEQNPVVNYNATGNYDVTLTISDGTNNLTTTKEGFIIVQNCTNTIDRMVSQVLVYPNPAKDYFELTLPENQTTTEIRLFSITGKEISKNVITGSHYQMDVNNLPSGIYFIRLNNQNLNETVKIVVNN